MPLIAQFVMLTELENVILILAIVDMFLILLHSFVKNVDLTVMHVILQEKENVMSLAIQVLLMMLMLCLAQNVLQDAFALKKEDAMNVFLDIEKLSMKKLVIEPVNNVPISA